MGVSNTNSGVVGREVKGYGTHRHAGIVHTLKSERLAATLSLDRPSSFSTSVCVWCVRERERQRHRDRQRETEREGKREGKREIDFRRDIFPPQHSDVVNLQTKRFLPLEIVKQATYATTQVLPRLLEDFNCTISC